MLFTQIIYRSTIISLTFETPAHIAEYKLTSCMHVNSVKEGFTAKTHGIETMFSKLAKHASCKNKEQSAYQGIEVVCRSSLSPVCCLYKSRQHCLLSGTEPVVPVCRYHKLQSTGEKMNELGLDSSFAHDLLGILFLSWNTGQLCTVHNLPDHVITFILQEHSKTPPTLVRAQHARHCENMIPPLKSSQSRLYLNNTI